MKNSAQTAAFICLLIFLAFSPGKAAAHLITVDFAYVGQADGFRLYQNGVQVCEITDGAARTMECDVTISADDEYTMSAITAGVAGPASVKHFAGRVRNVYKQMRGGSFAGGSM